MVRALAKYRRSSLLINEKDQNICMQHLLALISMHAACVHYKEKVPVSVDEICEHIPENCFKHKIVVHKSSNS